MDHRIRTHVPSAAEQRDYIARRCHELTERGYSPADVTEFQARAHIHYIQLEARKACEPFMDVLTDIAMRKPPAPFTIDNIAGLMPLSVPACKLCKAPLDPPEVCGPCAAAMPGPR